MPYIGTTPTKVVSRQSANVYRYEATAGQSVFTGADLDNNVLACNPADMIVHMNSLRLESTDYTATSASVTLTTAATAGDEVTVTSFVTFEVADTYTKTAADDRYVNTTGDTMTGALALPTGGLTVGTDQLAVDSAGRVTMPYQPYFHAYFSSPINITSGSQVIAFSQTVSNIGGHFNTSTYRFTVPVSGRYFLSAGIRWNAPSSTGGYTRFTLRRNGSENANSIKILDPINTFSEVSYQNSSQTVILDCTANDYFEVIEYSQYTGGSLASSECHFIGYLIG